MTEISIVIPLFNEEPCVAPLVEELDQFMAAYDRSCEIILVDDGSSDHTGDVAAELIQARSGYRLLALRQNRGQTTAMAAGLEHSRGEFIVFMDGDLQNSPWDIPVLINKLEQGYDLVSGWRRDRKDRTMTRKFPSKAANWLIGRFTGVRVHDYGCTLKAYRSHMVKKLNLYSDMHRFLPALCWRAGARVTEVVVNHRPRKLGTSKYGLNRIFKVMVDLIVIKLIVGFSDRPIQYFGGLSLAFLVLGVLTAGLWGYNLVEDWQGDTIIFPAVVILFFCCFFYFLLIGFLADMIVHVAPRDPAEVTTAGVMETH